MAKEWRNWAGDQRCQPARIERPRTLHDLAEVVEQAAEARLTVRAAGFGHSFSDIACTGGVMVDMRHFNRVLEFDRAAGLVKVEAGMALQEMNEELDRFGRAMENLGDIDRQALAGAVSTATHGTGARFRNISSQIEAVELVTGEGEVVELTAERDPVEIEAARVGLGALGILATITLRTVPAFTVRRVDSPMGLEEALGSLDELADESDHFEFYVWPHTDVALLRQSTRTDEEPERHRLREFTQDVLLENQAIKALARYGRRRPSQVPRLNRLLAARLGRGASLRVDRSYRVYASRRQIRFTEMEYAVPRKHAGEAARRVLELASRPELAVNFPVEVRFVAGDDAYLSTAHGRDTCYIAVHMFEGMPWESYFRGVEAIMDEYDGRPHWGKRHFQTAETLARRYPRWDDFQGVRARLDPAGRFRNEYIDRVLGPVGQPERPRISLRRLARLRRQPI